MKTGLYPEDLVVAHAARALQRPVRWRGQRLEEFTASVHGRDMFTVAETVQVFRLGQGDVAMQDAVALRRTARAASGDRSVLVEVEEI
jgi:CO/xanthine dehydrogenase Mo-binding subunit